MPPRKLTDNEIREIFLDLRSVKEVAHFHHITESYVSAIRTGRNHKKLTYRLSREGRLLENKIARLLSRRGEEETMELTRKVIGMVLDDVRKRI